MRKRSLAARLLMPAGIVLLLMGASAWVYDASWRIDHGPLRSAVAFLSGILLWLSIGNGALLAYPMARFRGAGLGERAVACLASPVIWNIKEMVRVSEFFTAGESIYYGLNSLFLLAVIGAFAQMGLCELLCRRRLRSAGQWHGRVATWPPVMAIVAGLSALFLMSYWGDGVHWFYVYMQGYKALFL
jgi:hypothetical protein